ncbi:MAG TPA: sigma factor-like helix-turn-helix DNA-binding protein, partial [bacterium]|nr:sigma factor-like helix-turn-helix DNA-binding protein [bacterium]
ANSSTEFEELNEARAELAACLHPMLEQLSPTYREALTLVELEGLTQKKAAERLGTTLSNMKSRVQRGRRQLRKILDECCLVQLDRRNAAMGFERRKGKCGSC